MNVAQRAGFWGVIGFGTALVMTTVTTGSGATAAPGPDEATFVPITPCRLFDTRPGTDNVGARATPLGHSEDFVTTVTGSQGSCAIPAGASGISLNVTALNATAPSYLLVYPFGSSRPVGSNLNYLPGQPPTPNKVDVKIGSQGRVTLFNANGTVDVIADAVGYYTRAGLSDLKDQLDRAATRPKVTTLSWNNETSRTFLNTPAHELIRSTVVSKLSADTVLDIEYHATGTAINNDWCEVELRAGGVVISTQLIPGGDTDPVTLRGFTGQLPAGNITIDVRVFATAGSCRDTVSIAGRADQGRLIISEYAVLTP